VSARGVAEVIGRIDGAMWLPRIASWEIAQTDNVWGAHGELNASGVVPAVMALTKLATEVGSELTDATARLMVVDFVHQEVPVRVWWLRPVVPVAHATAPVLLEDLAQTEHELTGARLALWEEEQETRRLRLAHASARRGRRALRVEGGRMLADQVEALRERTARVAELEQQATTARAGGFKRAIDVMRAEGLPMSVGLLEAQAELDTIDAGDLTVYRASHESIVIGHYTTAAAAREHCQAYVEREHHGKGELRLWWREDEDTVDQPEEGPAELIERIGAGPVNPTGYLVIPVTVAAAYDPDGDE
jgi:hypothetical protein